MEQRPKQHCFETPLAGEARAAHSSLDPMTTRETHPFNGRRRSPGVSFAAATRQIDRPSSLPADIVACRLPLSRVTPPDEVMQSLPGVMVGFLASRFVIYWVIVEVLVSWFVRKLRRKVADCEEYFNGESTLAQLIR